MGQEQYAGIHGQAMWTRSGPDAIQTWVHTPADGRSRGLVVLAPPVGREHVQSYRANLQLAMLLATEGYCVARVCYRGMGDAHALPADLDAVRAWTQDLLDTAAHARAVCGVADLPVWAVGHRIGGALAAQVADRFQAVIAWEPVSGSTFARQWSRLRRATLSEISVGDRVDLMGLSLSHEQGASLSRLPDPRSVDDLPAHVRIFREPDQPRAKLMYGVESYDSRVHYDVLDQLIRMLPRPELRPMASTGHGPLRNWFVAATGVECAEEIVRIEPKNYMGVLTGPVAGHEHGGHITPRPGKPVTFYAAGASEPRDGSALWSESARVLAGHGVASLRADRDGSGDRALMWAERDPHPYRLANAQALREQAQWMRERFKAPVVVTALCSGAWAALCAAREPERIPVDGMILINQTEWRMKQAFFDVLRLSNDADARLRAAAMTRDSNGSTAVTPRKTRVAWRTGLDRAASSVKAAGSHALRNHSPERVWNLMARHPEASIPDHTLERASRDARVVLLVGPQDEPRYRQTMTPRAVDRLAARGRDISQEYIGRLDHSILSRTARDVMIERVVELLTQWKGRSPANG